MDTRIRVHATVAIRHPVIRTKGRWKSRLITDPSSAAIQGAIIRLRGDATGISREAVTDESGNYNFQGLPVGQYKISVDHPGFSRAAASIRIDPSEKGRFDIQLTVGAPALRSRYKAQQDCFLMTMLPSVLSSKIQSLKTPHS